MSTVRSGQKSYLLLLLLLLRVHVHVQKVIKIKMEMEMIEVPWLTYFGGEKRPPLTPAAVFNFFCG